MTSEEGRHAALTRNIIGGAIEVHQTLGCGLLEHCYQVCLAEELRSRGLRIEAEAALPVLYRGRRIETAYRIDLLVERAVVIEIKSVEGFAPIHTAQMLTYLRLGRYEVGLLINFNKRLLRDGIRRISL